MFDINDIEAMIRTSTKEAPDKNIEASVVDAALVDDSLPDLSVDSSDAKSIEPADPTFTLAHIRSPMDVITLGSSVFTPSELESFNLFYNDNRPNLLRNNQPYGEGIVRYYMPKDSPDGKCGWYLVTDDLIESIPNEPELFEAYAPEFYGNAIPNAPYGDGYRDESLIDINANLIRAMASDYLFSIKEQLESKWGINKVFTLSRDRRGYPNEMKMMVINEDGSIEAHSVDRSTREYIKPHELFPVVDSWARINKVQFDTYRSRITIRDKAVSDQMLPKLISKVCNELGVNFKLNEFASILKGIAVDNEYNSLMERYHKLEKLEELKLLEAHDHTTVATQFLKIKDPTHRKYADEVLKHNLEKMVIRAMYPGFPHRSTVILSGPQNAGKSGILRVLCGDDHFCEIDSLSSGARDHGGAGHPDTQKKLTQHNLVVINEIGRVFSDKDISDDVLKNLITGETATYVDKYRSDITTRGRTSVIVGTTNTPHILTDLTGNSRYQIILCGITQEDPVDWERLEKVQQGILLSALQAVRSLAKGGISALKAHKLPQWVMDYSDKQNLEFLQGSEFIGLLSELVNPVIGTTTVHRTTISMREIASMLGLKSSEIKANRGEIDRAMKHHGFREWPKRVRFNGSTAQTVYIRDTCDKPASSETPSDCLPAGEVQDY